MTLRRVVTGHQAPAQAAFVSDDVIEPTVFSGSGNSVYQVWGADEPRELPDSGGAPLQAGPLPPPGGYRVLIFNLSATPTAEALGIHATDSTDVIVVIDGEVDLELDSGEIRTLMAGDTLVQNATAHRWVNRSGQPVRLAVFTVGAKVGPRTTSGEGDNR